MTSFLSNDIQVTDPDGRTVVSVVTTGGGLGRMLMGNRSFDVVDGDDGRVLFRLADPATFGRDRFAILDADGLPLAHLVRQFAFLRTSVNVEVVDGTCFAVTGDLWDHDYAMTVGQQPIARVTARFGGVMNALAGRSRYEMRLDPGMPPVVRCAVLGTAIALDLIRAKDRRSNS